MKDLQSQHDCCCFCKRKTGHGLLKECQNNDFGHFIYFYIKKKWWRCEDDRISFWSISSPSFGAIPGSKCRELLHLLISLYEKCCEQKALLITKVSKRTIFYIRVNSYNQITHLVLVDGFTCYCKCLLLVYLRKSGALTIMCWKSSSDRRPSLSRSASSITFSHTILTSSSVSSLRVSLFSVFSRSDLQMKSSLLKSYRKKKKKKISTGQIIHQLMNYST